MSNSISDFSTFSHSTPPTTSSPKKIEVREFKNFQTTEGRQLQKVFDQIKPKATGRRLFQDNPPKNPDVSLKRSLLNAPEPYPKKRAIEMTSQDDPPINLDQQITPIALNQLPKPNSYPTINFEELESKFNQPFTEKKIPPTPQKKRRPVREGQASLFQMASENALKGTLAIQGQSAQVKLLSDMGSYMNVFTIESLECIIPGKPNDSLVVKVFNRDRCLSSDRQLQSWMTTSMYHYTETVKLKVPVATIYNAETAPQLGYILQEKIAASVDVLKPDHIQQARQFFITFLQNKNILFDLLPSNLMLTEDGTMKLIDFTEEFYEDYMDDSWLDLIKHALEKWCEHYKKATQATSEQTLQFLNNFTNGFDLDGYDTSLNEDIVAGLFPKYA